MVDLLHLEEIARNTEEDGLNPRLNIFLKNVLYGRFDDQSRSLGGILRDQLSWKGLVTARTAESMISQLDLVRQVKFPEASEFVTLLEYCVRVTNELGNEANGKGYFTENQMEIQRIDQQLLQAAERDMEYVKQAYRSDLKSPIRPSNQYREGGFQAADMLRQYCQIYEIRQEHVQHLMRPQQRDQEGGSCLDVLLATMQSMETRRTQKSLATWSARVYKNAKLFVTDLTVSRGYDETSVLLDNKSLSVREGNLVLNPDLTGRGPRTNHKGELHPYVSVDQFYQQSRGNREAFLDVCLA